MKKNYIFALITILIWAFMATMVKLLLTDIPNLEALAISSVFAFLFLLIINVKTGKIKEMKQYSVKQYGVMAGLGFLGLFSVLNKKADYDQNITMMVIWLTVAVCSFAVGPFLEDWVSIRGTQWFGIIWLGVMTDAVAYLLWAQALIALVLIIGGILLQNVFEGKIELKEKA